MDKYLGGSGDIAETLAPPEVYPSRQGGPDEAFRPESGAITHEKRLTSFEGIEMPWTKDKAESEARRCLRCDLAYKPEKWRLNGGLCIYCGLCVESCPFDALYMGYDYERASYRLAEQTLEKEDLATPTKRRASAYAHPELEKGLPQQTLLLDRDGYKWE